MWLWEGSSVAETERLGQIIEGLDVKKILVASKKVNIRDVVGIHLGLVNKTIHAM